MDTKLDLNKKTSYEKNIYPVFSDYKNAIVFESSALFVPYLSVVLLSLLKHISPEKKYDIIILTNEIDDFDCKILLNLVDKLKNVSLRFFDPTNIVEKYIKNSRYKYLDINYYRMSLPWILRDYDRVLNLGADIVIERDVIELLECKMSNNTYLAGAIDLGYLGRLKMDIPKEELDLSNPYGYVNADVLVFNLNNIRRDFTQDEVMNIWQKYKFRCAEQDALNLLFDGHIKHVDLRWNTFPIRMASVEHIMKNNKKDIIEWEKCLKNPYIIHYAAFPKPWDYPVVGYGNKWWNCARKSPYYEEIIRRMCLVATRSDRNEGKILGRKFLDFIFPKGSKGRDFIKKMFPKNSSQREFFKKIYYTFFRNPNKEYNKKFGKLN